MQNNIEAKIIEYIKQSLEKSYLGTIINSTDLLNYINSIAKQHYGFDRFNMDAPDSYQKVYQNIKPIIANLNMKMKQNKNTDFITEALKSVLQETSFEIPTSRSIVHRDDDDVTKIIKDVFSKEFKNFTLESIQKNDGDTFYNMDVSVKPAENIGSDLELKRFTLAKTMAEFRSSFFTQISSFLPIVNINTAAYEFDKHSEKLKFSVTISISNTSIRDWVNGSYKAKKDNKKVEADKKAQVTEASSGKRSIVDAMPLNLAIKKYKDKTIDRSMLETAIKACGRSELEIFVLRYVGIQAEPIEAEPKKTKEKSEVKAIPESVSLNEAVRLVAEQFNLPPEVDEIEMVLKLQGLGLNAWMVSNGVIKVKWSIAKYTREQIEQIIQENK